MLRLVCGYTLQSKCLEEKQYFHDQLKGEWNMHSAGDLAMYLGDCNRCIGRHIDGFDGVYGGYGVGHRNLVGRMSLEFCLEKNYVCQIHGLREKRGMKHSD